MLAAIARNRSRASSGAGAAVAAAIAAATLSLRSEAEGNEEASSKSKYRGEEALPGSGGLIGVGAVPAVNNSKLCSCEGLMRTYNNRRQTISWLDKTSSKATLESRYEIDWDNPLGEGGFGAVYPCVDRETGEKRALKMIDKKFTDKDEFQREMDALLRVRESGFHPNICRLKENFEQRGNYYLILDLISGGEMFDHLAMNGPYSEADAARLVMETASALAFIHGIGLVHGDLKPENLMLSTPHKSDSVIKVVDFGCSEMYKGHVDTKRIRNNVVNTPAYSPPEAFGKYRGSLLPSYDMFSLGLILHIMLTGYHPFDLDGVSTEEEIEYRIKNEAAQLRNSPITAHLSDSAINLMEKLLDKRPRRRITAQQMLENSWVKGETAKKSKMKGSDEKLSKFRKFKSGLEAACFADWVSGADDAAKNKLGLIERAFKSFDTNEKGYVTTTDLKKTLTNRGEKSTDNEDDIAGPLSLSGFSDLLSENMASKYYPEGYKIYKEGARGEHIFFINSGTVEVSTRAGFKTTLSQGQLFGEGALLDPKGRRSATIRCLTPVHVIRISKDYFEKYMKSGGSEISLTLREQDRARDRDRALKILRLQKNLVKRDLSKNGTLFSYGAEGKELYIVEEGEIQINGETGKHIVNVGPGQICGEHSVITKLPRNTTAICKSNNCRVYEMASRDFEKVYNSSPDMKQSFREVCLRRDVQKAIAKKLGKDFGSSDKDLREAFEAADLDGSDDINLDDIKGLMKSVYPSISDDDPLFTEVLKSLDIDDNNSVDWEEFKKVFS